MTNETRSFGPALIEGIRENAKYAIATGIFLVIVGVLALAAPFATGVSVTFMIGVLMIFGGIAECTLAFRAGAFGRGVLVFLMGVLMVLAGIYMVGRPVAALMSMTLLLAAYFIVAGIIESVAAFGLKPAEGWGWMLFNAVVTLLLGFMVWRQFPLSGIWAIGILFGIKLLVSGSTLLGLGVAVRRGVKSVAKA